MNAFSLPARPTRTDDRRIHRGVRPIDPPRARASGPAPYRVLAIGGGLLTGTGVLTHDLALSGAIARGLARRLGHGVDVGSCIDERGVEVAMRSVRDEQVSRVDAVVLVLDGGQLHDDAAAAGSRTGRLANRLRDRLAPSASITVVVPPVPGDVAARQGRAFVEAIEHEAGASTRVVRLADRVLVQSAAERYGIWGETIAAAVAEHLVDPIVWSDAIEQLDERRRSSAVRRLGDLDEQWEEAFRRIVTFARQAYGASCAALSVIDDERTRYLVRQGFDTRSIDRGSSICDLALHTYGGLIVGDARADDRFHRFPLVTSGAVRFYAGYRFESPDGEPLGVLCVFDPEPRPVLSQDLALLRDFAASAERRLWQLGRTGTVG